MTPQAAGFLEKAQELLTEADTMLSVGLNEAAGRTAYFAGFHAVQAFLFERLKKVFKTHHGVQTEFLRLTKDDSRVDNELRAFLSQTYNLKSIADYETGPGSHISAETASDAVAAGKQFVTRISGMVPPVPPPP
jgi:uncharacterized protein (UPF0332 family)